MNKHYHHSMHPSKVTEVWAIYARLGYVPDHYPTKHAVSDEEQGYLDLLLGAVRATS